MESNHEFTQGLRQEMGEKLRVTIISPGFVHTDFAESMTNPEVKAQIIDTRDEMAISLDPIARAIAFAIEQPANNGVNEIVIVPPRGIIPPSLKRGAGGSPAVFTKKQWPLSTWWPQSLLDEREQVGVDRVRLRGRHAVWKALVRLQRPVLQ